jgi:hypothetical protein
VLEDANVKLASVTTMHSASAGKRCSRPSLLAKMIQNKSPIGGRQRIAAKLEAYAHQDQTRFKDHKYLAMVIGLGIDLLP